MLVEVYVGLHVKCPLLISSNHYLNVPVNFSKIHKYEIV
jgi:hypothetical protein